MRRIHVKRKGADCVRIHCKRLLCLFWAMLIMITAYSASAEMPAPTLDPGASPYDSAHPELLEENQLVAAAAVLMEESSGEIIFEKDPDRVLYPASTTKIMTVLLGILTCDLDEVVTVSANAVNLPDDATTMGLREGEEIVMLDLLYGTLMRSGNDGAIAIAEHVSGSVEAFADLMNTTAAAFGMTNTHFRNPHGLHEDYHFSTARDMAILARQAMSNETFRLIAGETRWNLPATNMQRERTIETRHRIMLPTYRNEDNQFYYKYATGIKSGFHSLAQYCYVGSASKEGVDLISVVLYSGQYDYMRDTKKLFEYGFSQYTSVTLTELYEMNPFKVYTTGYSLDDRGLGELLLSCSPANPLNTVEITATYDQVERLADSLRDQVFVEYTRDLVAPITAGEVLGTMTYMPEVGEPVVYNLLATRSIEQRKNAPLTLDQIVAMTEADPNPFPPLTIEILLILLSPFIVLALVILIIALFVRRIRKHYARLPKNSNRYVK